MAGSSELIVSGSGQKERLRHHNNLEHDAGEMYRIENIVTWAPPGPGWGSTQIVPTLWSVPHSSRVATSHSRQLKLL